VDKHSKEELIEKINEKAHELSKEYASEVEIDTHNTDTPRSPYYKESPQEDNRSKLHFEMLEFVVRGSEKISNTVQESEANKKNWRDKILAVSVGLFVAMSIFFVIYLIAGALLEIRYGIDILSNQIIFTTVGLIIANIVSILVLFINFINNEKSLEIFKVMHTEFLNYLAKDKNNWERLEDEKSDT